MSGDLTAFIMARLDEEEAAAKAAKPGQWTANLHWDRGWRVLDGPDEHNATLVAWSPGPVLVGNEQSHATAAHIARHDPARVLREVEADRAILGMYEERDGYDLPEGVYDGRDPDEREADEAVKDALYEVVKIRAARFDGHPDYRQEWKP